MFRLFSQLAQDCQWKVGKVIWVAGHTGPETADDSRTHFGVFAPGVTQLFPKGHIINLHPWEYNEVPVLLAAALKQDVPLIALHLTRPPVAIPDRNHLGMPSYFAAAQGAYIVRDHNNQKPKQGTFYVRGTSAMANLVKVLPRLDEKNLNVKIVYVSSSELFDLQPDSYKQKIVTPADRFDSTIITTQGRSLMVDWMFNPLAGKYALSADWDDRWRTGGTMDEVLDEAHLSAEWILAGIEKFAREREKRLKTLRAGLDGTAE
jgi:transketolase